jgi:polar amino acid transport system substrate-binding protein
MQKYFWLFIFSGLFSSYLHACVLRVQVNDFPPYSYLKDDKWQGSRVVLSTRLAEKLGCQLQLLDLTWARALAMLETGDLDLMFNLTVTADRQKFIMFTAPHHHERLVFATSLADWKEVSTIDELRLFPGVIAITQGSYMGAPFMSLLENSRFKSHIAAVSQRKAKNELVLKNRAQGVVEDQDFLKFAMNNYPGYDNVFITPLVFAEQDVCAGFSKKSPMYSRKSDIELAISQLDQLGLWFSEQP